ncbi:MAG: hypothetical protein CML46_18940 [Rhodobacteraceae bacterium]|nr:hypothetical protein [Paracoccaceae bacterium]
MTSSPSVIRVAGRAGFASATLWAAMTVAGLGLGLGVGVGEASAQSIAGARDIYRDALSRSPLASDYQALALFAGEKGLSSAHYTIDGDTISTTNFPMGYTFADMAAGARPFVEGVFGWSSLSQRDSAQFHPTRGPTDIRYDLSTYSAIGGAGVEFDGPPGLRVRPVALIGYSRVEDDSEFTGPGARFADAATRGILLNARVDSLLYGGALELLYDAPFTDEIDFSFAGRYTRLWADVVDASDPAWERSSASAFDTVTGHAEFEGPTGATLMGRDLRWIGFVGGASLIGSQGAALGFTGYGEVGAGIRVVDRETFPYIEGGAIRGSVLVGDDMIGWSIGATLDF